MIPFKVVNTGAYDVSATTQFAVCAFNLRALNSLFLAGYSCTSALGSVGNVLHACAKMCIVDCVCKHSLQQVNNPRLYHPPHKITKMAASTL